MKLRDYQDAAVRSIFDYFINGGTGNPIVALPTGTGKSVIIGEFIRQAFFQYPNTRVMKLTHVKELLEQNLDKLLQIWPTAPAGIFSAGLKQKDAHYPITFGGVASVAKASISLFSKIDLLLIDECHLLSPNDKTMYQAIITRLKEVNPHLKMIGFTATPYRLGQGKLIEDGLFTDLCFDLTGLEAFNWFITEGYLCPLVPKRTTVELDISGVHTQSGEFKQNELQAAVDIDSVTYSACQEMIAYGLDRHCWLIFCSGIEHSVHVAAMLDSLGISAAHVHSKMASKERDRILADFKAGKFKALCNNGIVTTGFDHPAIDFIGMLRPTQSPGLFVQMLGRGTRPMYAPGFDLETTEGRLASIVHSQKQNCLVMDFARNTKRLGPINDPVLPKRKGKGGGGVAPVKVCEVCNNYNHASIRFCVHCGAEFPKQVKIMHSAGTEELLASSTPVVELFKVDRITYNLHQKEGRPDSIKVSYYCGLRLFKEYVCLEHGGFAAKKARDMWRERSQQDPPATTAEALLLVDSLRVPSQIRVWLKPKYDEILSYDYGDFNNDQS